MANRFPLIFNSGAGQIQELAASDNLDLTSSNLVNAGILFTSSGSVTAPSLQIGSGTTYNPGLYSPGTDQLAVATNGVERVKFGTTEVVFNDGGTDYDFRVEGDTNANLFFVDASTDRIGVGSNSPSSLLHLSVASAAVDGTKGVRITNPAGTIAMFECGSAGDSFVGTTSGSDFQIRTNNTSRIHITTGGLVGIGVTGPAGELDVRGSNSGNLYVGRTNNSGAASEPGSINFSGPNASGNARVWGKINSIIDTATQGSEAANLAFLLQKAGNLSEVARLDGSGRLLVGTATVISNNYGGTAGRFQVAKDDYLPIGFFTYNNTAGEAGYCPYLELNRARGTQASPSAVGNGDDLGLINFYGHDGSAFIRSATIKAVVDGAVNTTNDMPGRLVFSTTPDSGSSPTSSPPAMTIKSSQEVLIGTSTITANGGILQLKSGITFPATAVAATDVNTLDDYEEGTWTPVVTGWTSVTYTVQDGKYIKIGKHLTAWFYIEFSGTSAATDVTITGLPFTEETYSRGGSLTYYSAPLNETSGVLIYPAAGTIRLYTDSDLGAQVQSNGNASISYLIGSINSIRS